MFWLSQVDLLKLYEGNHDEELHESLKKSAINERQTPEELVFLQGGCKAFSSTKNFTPGQYVVPFSFKLPEDIPGTYHIKQMSENGQEHDI